MKKLISIAVASALLSGVATAHSAVLDTTGSGTAGANDGTLLNFSGIDWHANGSAWIQNFNLTNAVNATSSFSLTYQAFAASIDTTSAFPNLFVASPGPQQGTYELTIFSEIQETATCLAAGAVVCSAVSISTDSGTWSIYLDDSTVDAGGPDANMAAGTGLTNGVLILSGEWDSGLSTFLSNGIPPGTVGAQGTGGGALQGRVTFTNNDFINPNLLGTTFQASLQFPGLSAPNFTPSASFNGIAPGANTATNFVIQADGSQNFTVPEPATLALFGIGLLGLGMAGRRRV